MSDEPLDEVDRAILYELQRDARNNTNAQIAERVGVSASTVGKRISRLEEEGIIQGYQPDIDYEAAGYPLQVLFVCTAPITDREDLIQQALEIETVVNAKEMMTGDRNVHIEVVGRTNDEITDTARRINDLGFTVVDEVLMRAAYPQPSVVFRDRDSRQGGTGTEP